MVVMTKAQKRVERMRRYMAKTTPTEQIWTFEGYHEQWHAQYQEMGNRFGDKMKIKFGDHPFTIDVRVVHDEAITGLGTKITLRVRAFKQYPR